MNAENVIIPLLTAAVSAPPKAEVRYRQMDPAVMDRYSRSLVQETMGQTTTQNPSIQEQVETRQKEMAQAAREDIKQIQGEV